MNTLLGLPEGAVTTSLGKLLRRWREVRGMSQLTLATEAGISTRDLSFLETGRAQPSREMVQPGCSTCRLGNVALLQLKIGAFSRPTRSRNSSPTRLASAAPRPIAV